MTEHDTGPRDLITQDEAAERRLAESSPAPVPATRDDGPLMAAIQRAASDPNFDVEKLRALREIQREWDAEQNKRAYDDALSRAQADMPVVKRNKHTQFGEGAKEVDYHYADYGAVVQTIVPALTAEGFSFDHKVVQDVSGDGHKITVTCTLKRGGHSESVTMFAPPEGSPGMNIIQKVKSTTTYLKRTTLEAVSGAATEDEDDDGRNASASGGPELIGGSELAFLNAEIDEIGDALDLPKFLAYLEVESIEELPSAQFGKAKQALAAKRRKLSEGVSAPEADGEPQPHEYLEGTG